MDMNPLWVKVGDVFEECRIRYGTHLVEGAKDDFMSRCSFPSQISERQLTMAQRMIDILTHAGADAIVRFSDSQYMKPFCEHGNMRMSLSTSYNKALGDQARYDHETQMELILADDRKSAASVRKTVRCDDYWMWCATRRPENVNVARRLFGDFDADSCVVIRQGNKFLTDLARLWRLLLPRSKALFDEVRYEPISKLLQQDADAA